MSDSIKIDIPYRYHEIDADGNLKFLPPYQYQEKLFKSIWNGYKRAFVLWHRRAGKDKTMFNMMVVKALERVGTYYYFFPTYAQGKKVIWEGIDMDGFRFIDHIPKGIRDGLNEQEMKIRLYNGSVIQIIGTDNYDSIRGTNPVGVVFSEYAYQTPGAWDVVSPILLRNGGWAVFNTTPNGENHAYDLFMYAKNSDKWFTEVLTIDDTKVVSLEDIEEERRSGKPEEFIQQEYWCSFTTAIVGAFYAEELRVAESEGRLSTYPYNPDYLVYTGWDIGVSDQTSIWFWQEIDGKQVFIDFLQDSGKGLRWYVDDVLAREYVYGGHYFPHDAKQRQKDEDARTVERIASELGLKGVHVLKRMRKSSQIEMVRMAFRDVRVDMGGCSEGLVSLRNYVRQFDQKKNRYTDKEYHNWASDGATAFAHAIQAKRDRGVKGSDGYYVETIPLNSW